MKKIYYTWEDLNKTINIIANKIIDSKIEINGIRGIPRGGLVPAVILSHRLDKPLLNNSSLTDKTVLVVDDISDSGNTLKYYTLYGCPIVTLHTKMSSIVIPTFYGGIVADDEYIYYPWENKDSDPIADYLK